MYRSGLIIGLTVLVGSVLGACGPAPAPPPARSAESSTLVLDLVTRSGADYLRGQYELSRVEDGLIAVCMRAQGFRYVVPTATVPDASVERASLVVQRQGKGYGLNEQYADPRSMSGPVAFAGTNDNYVAHLSPAKQAGYLNALRGDPGQSTGLRLSDGHRISYPDEGCEARSRIAIYQDLTTALQIDYVPQIVRNAVQTSIQGDRRYAEVLRRWRTCLTAAGERYPSPSAARSTLDRAYRKEGSTKALRRRETEVAIKDKKCDRAVGLSSTALVVAQSYLHALPIADRKELVRLAGLRLAAVERARRIDVAGITLG